MKGNEEKKIWGIQAKDDGLFFSAESFFQIGDI